MIGMFWPSMSNGELRPSSRNSSMRCMPGGTSYENGRPKCPNEGPDVSVWRVSRFGPGTSRTDSERLRELSSVHSLAEEAFL